MVTIKRILSSASERSIQLCIYMYIKYNSSKVYTLLVLLYFINVINEPASGGGEFLNSGS